VCTECFSTNLKTMENLFALNTEQSFTHVRFMSLAESLDKKELLEVLDRTHTQYAIQKNLFTQLTKWCVRNRVELPCFTELLKQTPPDHPADNKQSPDA
jgi:hypothetical protein